MTRISTDVNGYEWRNGANRANKTKLFRRYQASLHADTLAKDALRLISLNIIEPHRRFVDIVDRTYGIHKNYIFKRFY